MGIDFGAFFGDAQKKVEESLNDLVKVGRPAIVAGLEQWGIDTLQSQLKESQKELNTAVKEITAKEPEPGSFGAAMQATVKNTVLESYGIYIVGGVIALVAVGFFMRGK